MGAAEAGVIYQANCSRGPEKSGVGPFSTRPRSTGERVVEVNRDSVLAMLMSGEQAWRDGYACGGGVDERRFGLRDVGRGVK